MVERRRRVRTAQSERRISQARDISSNDHPARSGRPINRQDLAWLPEGGIGREKSSQVRTHRRFRSTPCGARRCIWCGKISRCHSSSPSSYSVFLPISYPISLLSIDGLNLKFRSIEDSIFSAGGKRNRSLSTSLHLV